MNAKVIVLTSSESRAGKTMLCIELAGILSRIYNKKVLIIDAAYINGISVFFENNQQKDFSDMFRGKEFKSLIYNDTDFDYVPIAKESVGYLKEMDANTNVNTDILRKSLEQVRKDYDYIFVDSMSNYQKLSQIAITAADVALVPINVGIYARQHLQKSGAFIENISRYTKQNLQIKIVWNRNAKKGIIKDYIMSSVNSFIEEKNYSTLHTMIETDYKGWIQKAQQDNIAIGRSKPSYELCDIFQQFLKVANELVSI